MGKRLGVTDAAVHKAIKTGRVTAYCMNESGKRKMMIWPDARDQWLANSDTTKRSHVGGGKRASPLPTSDTMGQVDDEIAGDAPGIMGPKSGRGRDYQNSRAKREHYQAELAQLEYEKAAGKLVDADEVRAEARKVASSVISTLYTIPDRISDELAGMNDAFKIQRLLINEFDKAVEQLRMKYAND